MDLTEDIRHALYAMRLARLLAPHEPDDRVEELASKFVDMSEEELAPIARALGVES